MKFILNPPDRKKKEKNQVTKSTLSQAPKRTHDQSLDHLPLAHRLLPRSQTQQAVRAPQTSDFGAALSPRASRVDPSIAPGRQHHAMVLWPSRIAWDVLVQHDLGSRQPVRRRAFAGGEVQRRQHEQVGCHKRGGRVAGQAEYEFCDGVAGVVLEGHGGEGAGFAGLHGDAAEADGAAEGALDGGFEEVELAHGDAARGHDDVDGAEGGSEMLF